MEAYPLSWPDSYERTKYPKHARFTTKFTMARDGLMNELRLMRARYIVISTNIPLRNDGLPYANYKEPRDQGVAVYFNWNKEAYTLACDKWNKVVDNLQAIKKTVEAMRGLDRWGVSEMLKRTFQGFKAIPEQTGESKNWWEVLGCSPNDDHQTIRKKYLDKIKECHPDKKNGDKEKTIEIIKAYNDGLQVKFFKGDTA